MKKILWGLTLLSLTSCNIFTPFNSDSSTEDFLEDALHCLDNNDYACALAAYNKLPDGPLKDQKLCTTYLSAEGVTVNVLVNIVSENSATMLGDLAQALIPWNPTQASYSTSAITACDAYQTDNPTDDTAILIQSMSELVDCAIRIARSDQFVQTADSQPCTTPGNDDGQITQTDIEGTGVQMCDTDVQACAADIINISAAQLSSAGLSQIATAYGLIPSALRNSGAATDVIRDAIKTTVPAS